MAGIYIHIPFCHQKCNYCDFYKTLNTSRKAEFLAALKKEALERVSYLNGAPVESVYLGGGTPSVLNEEEIGSLLDFIRKCFTVLSHAEITLEANPDDLNPGYLRSLNDLGINRLSIGIQSFNDFYLKKMNRRHNGQQAV
ncbi:MAG: radical SAM protein, partial [Mariniphaga sp.]